MISKVGGNVADGINNIYEDYTESKSNKRKYSLMDGVRSFTRSSAMKKLTKDYEGLHPRLKLKNFEILDSEISDTKYEVRFLTQILNSDF
jgi:hypothetical protein